MVCRHGQPDRQSEQAARSNAEPPEPDANQLCDLSHGKGVSASAYIDALATMNVLRRQMGAFFAAYDLLLTPTTAELALPHAAQDQDADYDALGWTRYMWHPDIFLPLYNITGNPAISLPLHQAKTGAQIGDPSRRPVR
ncbi:MAG: amidase family protein [Hyphomicrobiaceae bacterium]